MLGKTALLPSDASVAAKRCKEPAFAFMTAG
jgi:hypothetical protein